VGGTDIAQRHLREVLEKELMSLKSDLRATQSIEYQKLERDMADLEKRVSGDMIRCWEGGKAITVGRLLRAQGSSRRQDAQGCWGRRVCASITPARRSLMQVSTLFVQMIEKRELSDQRLGMFQTEISHVEKRMLQYGERAGAVAG
jgi:hypothetical protein